MPTFKFRKKSNRHHSSYLTRLLARFCMAGVLVRPAKALTPRVVQNLLAAILY
ncbi:hypothetical protein BN1221_02762c [Brenneria goodwinii]|uniref:Uncharacterized protein n=1 Tax=Brenneria goodwinii TaxID=1109412 RepID=A0A0G4JWN2_9GAMM|nr:hypothetical protein BN1221_02762c [Brenneria goodwinii]